jgi:hypothetical protein
MRDAMRLGKDVAMPKRFPPEFKRDVMTPTSNGAEFSSKTNSTRWHGNAASTR